MRGRRYNYYAIARLYPAGHKSFKGAEEHSIVLIDLNEMLTWRYFTPKNIRLAQLGLQNFNAVHGKLSANLNIKSRLSRRLFLQATPSCLRKLNVTTGSVRSFYHSPVSAQALYLLAVRCAGHIGSPTLTRPL